MEIPVNNMNLTWSEPRSACPVCSSPSEYAVDESPNYLSCPSCKLVYRKTVTHVSPEETWDSHFSDDRVAEYYDRRISGFKKMVSIVNRLVPGRGQWLDIGCGPGVLLNVAYDQGWEVHGIEPSRVCVAVIRKRMKHADVIQGTVEERLQEFRDFNVVSLVNMLRYIEHPGTILFRLRDVLAEGGWVLIREVNADSQRRERYKEIGGIAASRTLSLQEWIPRSLEHALRLAGFRKVQSIPSPTFIEISESEHDDGIRMKFEKLVRMGLWPASRIMHNLSLGRIYLGPNFITLGQK